MEIQAKAGRSYEHEIRQFCAENGIFNPYQYQQSKEPINGYITVKISQPFENKMPEENWEKITRFLQTLAE